MVRASPATSPKTGGILRLHLGPIKAAADIAHMMQHLFHRDATDYRWEMFDLVFDGVQGYAWSLSSFTSTIPQFAGKRVVIDGMSRFLVRDGLIAEYRESVNGGVAMAQLGVVPERMAKVFARWTGWLEARPEPQGVSPARPKGARGRQASTTITHGRPRWTISIFSTRSATRSRPSRSTVPIASTRGRPIMEGDVRHADGDGERRRQCARHRAHRADTRSAPAPIWKR